MGKWHSQDMKAILLFVSVNQQDVTCTCTDIHCSIPASRCNWRYPCSACSSCRTGLPDVCVMTLLMFEIRQSRIHRQVHPGRLTAGSYNSPILEGKLSEPNIQGIMFPKVNLQGCTCQWFSQDLRLTAGDLESFQGCNSWVNNIPCYNSKCNSDNSSWSAQLFFEKEMFRKKTKNLGGGLMCLWIMCYWHQFDEYVFFRWIVSTTQLESSIQFGPTNKFRGPRPDLSSFVYGWWMVFSFHWTLGSMGRTVYLPRFH